MEHVRAEATRAHRQPARRPPAAAAANAVPPPAAAASPAQAAARQAAYEACSFDRKLALFSLFFHGSTQIVSLLAWHTLPASERWQRVGSIVYAFGPLLIPMLVPEWYMRGQHRAWVMAIYRIGFFSFPLLRQPRGIQKVLGGAVQPGARGMLKDLLRLIWGSRLVAVMSSAAMNPLSILGLVPQLALLLYAVGMVRANPSLCSSALTTHPLSQQRMRGMHDLMHLGSMLLPGGIGQAASAVQQHSPELDCESFLSFLFILVGVVLPLAVLAWTEPPASLRAWEQRRQAASSADRTGGGGSSNSAGSGGSDSGASGGAGGGGGGRASSSKGHGVWSRALAAGSRACYLLEAGMRELCGRSWMAPAQTQQAQRTQHTPRTAATVGAHGPNPSADLELRWSLAGWQRGIAWWLLISLIWGLCRLHHAVRMAQ